MSFNAQFQSYYKCRRWMPWLEMFLWKKEGITGPFLNFHGAPPTPEAFGFFLYEVIIEGACGLFFGPCNPWRGLLFHSEEREAFLFRT